MLVFGCCGGCIDGIVVWTHKPSKEDCEEIGVSEAKFFCGRKHKFGLNMQAICNHKKQFLDISIIYGAATSDLMAFEVSAPVRYHTCVFCMLSFVLINSDRSSSKALIAYPLPNLMDETIPRQPGKIHGHWLQPTTMIVTSILLPTNILTPMMTMPILSTSHMLPSFQPWEK